MIRRFKVFKSYIDGEPVYGVAEYRTTQGEEVMFEIVESNLKESSAEIMAKGYNRRDNL